MAKLLLVPVVSGLALSLIACSDDPVSYSEPVSINIKVKAPDASTAVVSDDKSITTEQSNPYGAFVASARAALGGHDPGRIEVDRATLLLGTDSTRVSRLDEVFAGDVSLLFRMNDSDNLFPVAGDDLTGTAAGPVDLAVTFDADAMSDDDLARLVGGSFKVVVRGTAAAGFRDKGAEAALQATMTFTAFE